MDQLVCDLTEARKFLNFLAADESDKSFVFQTYDDAKQGRRDLCKTLSGTFDEVADKLVALNKQGAGISVTINKSVNGRRRKEDICALRAAFGDKDNGEISTYKLQPSLIVSAKRGPHPYWKLVKDQNLQHFKAAQEGIAQTYDSDINVSDLSRPMRLPGFFNMKDPKHPFLVKVLCSNGVSYSLDEVIKAHPASSSNYEKTLKKFRKFCEALPTETKEDNKFGGRNPTIYRLITEGLGRAIQRDDLKTLVLDYCARSKAEVDRSIELLERLIEEHLITPFTSHTVDSSEFVDAHTLTKDFLAARSSLKSDRPLLVYWKDEFYEWRDSKYVQLVETDLTAEIIKFLQANPKVQKNAGKSLPKEINNQLRGFCFLPSSVEIPTLLSDSSQDVSKWVSFANGIINLADVFKNDKIELKPHSPDFFSLSKLPYRYDAGASCPTWLKFLEEMVPDPEMQAVLQEWFGYNLIFDTTFNKFVILLGEGSNGKSVICAVLISVLGEENISSVNLEAFDPKRTFPLAFTQGKLANIVEEIGELDKTAEGVVKEFTGGKAITVEKKNKNPFQLVPTARLTFATNALPRFADKSNGLWRRLLLFPLDVQILDEAKQNKNLLNLKWWLDSDELPGVFNWSLVGLKRLLKQKHFSSSSKMAAANASVKKDASPARTFIELYLHESRDGRLSSHDVYQEYKDWCKDNGFQHTGSSKFVEEVRRCFPKAEKSKHAVTFGNIRAHAWTGIDWINPKVVVW